MTRKSGSRKFGKNYNPDTKIGVAVSDATGTIATPHSVIDQRGDGQFLGRCVLDLDGDWKIRVYMMRSAARRAFNDGLLAGYQRLGVEEVATRTSFDRVAGQRERRPGEPDQR